MNIFERKQEARYPFFRVVELSDQTEDPAVWGKNFPLQTTATVAPWTRCGRATAAASVPRTPSQADPRSVVAQSRLEEDPRLKTMWAGYAFAVDFREERGHAYMLDDQTFTERQQVAKQPGTCMHCHGSVYLPYTKLGGGDLIKGFEAMNQMPYTEARKLVSHPVVCLDCHDSADHAAAGDAAGLHRGHSRREGAQGTPGYDVNTMATRQEMRAFVCGQCHVEYYFKGTEKRLTYPWEKGLKADDILSYYQGNGFKDWTHAESGAPALKAQHPEFEMWNQGIHARSGVTCTDCHMPYQREGALKISDHHVQSPLLNINRACQTCHRWSEEELRERVLRSRTAPTRSQRRDGRAGGAHRRHQGRRAGRPDRRATGRGARRAAPGAVPARLHRGRKLHGVPRAAGSDARAGDLD